MRPDLPVGAEVWGHGVVVRRKLRVHRQLAEVEDLADAATDRKGPAVVAVGGPIGGDDRRRGQIQAAFEVVVEKGLNQSVVVVAALLVVGQRPISALSGLMVECDSGERANIRKRAQVSRFASLSGERQDVTPFFPGGPCEPPGPAHQRRFAPLLTRVADVLRVLHRLDHLIQVVARRHLQ